MDLRDELDTATDALWQHPETLRRHGIPESAAYRCGGLGLAQVTPTGRIYLPRACGSWAFLVPVWCPAAPSIYRVVDGALLLDLIAFDPREPWRWWHRAGDVPAVLGGEHLDEAGRLATAAPVFFDPLGWLQNDCAGAVLLDYFEAPLDVNEGSVAA